MLRLGLSASCGATALALGAALVAMPGCTDSSNGGANDGAGTFEAGVAPSSTACGSCLAVDCMGPWALCLTDSRCLALRGCNNPFSESAAAREQCICDGARTSDPASAADGGADPLALYAAFASCNDARSCAACASDCASSCKGGAPKTTAGACPSADAGSEAGSADAGDAGDAGDAAVADASAAPVSASVETCAACVSNKCGDAKKACALGTECSLFLACASACSDATCDASCGAAHATGKASAIELSNCTLTGCRSACGL